MEEFLYTLAAAALAGLAWVAYKHPKGFRRLYWPLHAVITLGYLVATLWSISSSVTATVLIPFMRDPMSREAAAALDAVRPPLGVGLFVVFGLLIYLSVLFFLPNILGLKDDEDN